MELSFGVRLLLVLAAALAAIVVGMTAGLLARLDGASAPACVTRGSAAFGISLTLMVLVLTSLGVLTADSSS
ncbi:hypothetical protein FCH28_05585 [Streptomyces piniterrae]|uniref:Uncharacterized protein n=1 Tax=Streptomyces piniterrae TaxID=2571125 RepID=A0A4U0NQZ2_9ACTN|nr:hypothetical protein [Streptomyces piniterrae]TJZ56956.1 hypothetical protein FCH28_05585 [Streptomyces piniterrae]